MRPHDAVAHGAVSRTIGTQIAVLRKNDGGVLPLDAGVGSIVLIGQSTFVDAHLRLCGLSCWLPCAGGREDRGAASGARHSG